MSTTTKAPLDMSFEATLEELRAKMANLAVDNHWLQLENARLARENGDLLDELHSATEAVKELQAIANRAHTEGV